MPNYRLKIQLLFIFLSFFFLSIQYKVDNVEAVRPLYTFGIILLGLYFIISLLKKHNWIAAYKLFNLKSFFLFCLLLYIFIHSFLHSDREIKDALYLVYWILIMPYIIMLNIVDYKLTYKKFTSITIYFSIFASLVAFLVFFNIINLDFGIYRLEQNYWTAFRIHGFMGQPTALGGLIGLSLIFMSYYSNSSKFVVILLYIFLIITLLATGSRNAMISLFVVYLFTKLISIKLHNILLIYLIFPFTALVFFLVYDNIDSGYIYHIVNRNDFGGQEDSRLYVWYTVLNLITNNEIIPFIFGNGSGSLCTIYRAAFNVPLHIFYDYGLIGFVLYILSFLLPFILGIYKLHSTKNIIYLLGCQILLYGFVFNMFISSFLSPFFSFQVLAFILGIFILSSNFKTSNIHTFKLGTF